MTEVAYPSDMPNLGEGKLRVICDAYKHFEDVFGETHNSGSMTFVYSPRLGWGYSRAPLVVNPAFDNEHENGSPAQNHHDYHELAHFWWGIANTREPDDWINEGGAEYSAFLLSRKHHPKKFTDSLLEAYIADIEMSETRTPIISTQVDSPDRYVNRYEKTTVMFLGAEMRYGQEHLLALLRLFYSEFRETSNATTNAFLNAAEVSLGTEARSYFKRLLSLASWKSINIRNEILRTE